MDSEIYVKIIENSSDIHDWLNFMIVSKDICNTVYPKFIERKFRIMMLIRQRISQCVKDNYKIKVFGDHLVITDPDLIEKHFQFTQPIVYETYGLFISRINYNNMKVDYDKVVDFVYDNEYLVNVAKRILMNKNHISTLSPTKSYLMALARVKCVRGENYLKNKKQLNLKYHKYLKLSVTEGYNYQMDTIYLMPNYCIFCHKYRDDKDYHANFSNSTGHGWKNNYPTVK